MNMHHVHMILCNNESIILRIQVDEVYAKKIYCALVQHDLVHKEKGRFSLTYKDVAMFIGYMRGENYIDWLDKRTYMNIPASIKKDLAAAGLTLEPMRLDTNVLFDFD